MPNLPAPRPPRWSAPPWTARQTRQQFAAIAWLRWRITVNAMRRKGGQGEFAARLLVNLIFASAAVIPTVGAGVGSFYFAETGHLERIAWILWATFLLCQFLNVQLGQPGSAFDPTQLIRFPVSQKRYVVIRLGFGLLSAANVVAVLTSLATAIGIGIASPELAWAAVLALAVFASANVLFSRMVFAWVDRWLATRHAREIFSGLVFAFSLSAEWVNLTYNPAYRRGHHHADPSQRLIWLGHLYRLAEPYLHALPPELTTSALLAARAGQPTRFYALSLSCALFSALFLGVFALRMRTEFRGENLSDNAVSRAPAMTSHRASDGRAASATAVDHPGAFAKPATGEAPASRAGEVATGARRKGPCLSPVVSAVFAKELLYIRRSSGIFYSLIAPVVLVFLFAGKLAANQGASWIFPAALAYTLLGVAPLSYNSFALEGTGSQFYFLAPIHLREVFLAKNLINFSLGAVEAAAVFGIVTYLMGMPSPQITLAALLWSAATLLLSTTVGNRRSVAAPRRIKSPRAMSRQASPLSGFIAMAVFLGSACIGVALWKATDWLNLQWALTPIFAIWFGTGLLIYRRGLGGVSKYAADHREELFTELCKKD